MHTIIGYAHPPRAKAHISSQTKIPPVLYIHPHTTGNTDPYRCTVMEGVNMWCIECVFSLGSVPLILYIMLMWGVNE